MKIIINFAALVWCKMNWQRERVCQWYCLWGPECRQRLQSKSVWAHRRELSCCVLSSRVHCLVANSCRAETDSSDWWPSPLSVAATSQASLPTLPAQVWLTPLITAELHLQQRHFLHLRFSFPLMTTRRVRHVRQLLAVAADLTAAAS